jgi:hypothetical protein
MVLLQKGIPVLSLDLLYTVFWICAYISKEILIVIALVD